MDLEDVSERDILSTTSELRVTMMQQKRWNY
jgi:hypothetical protein